MSIVILFAIAYGAVLMALFAYGFNGYVLVTLRRRWTPPAEIEIEDWPHVVVQLPVYNERDVVTRVIEAVGRLRYPGRLTIQVLDDSTDDTPALVKAALDRLDHRDLTLQHVRREDRVGYKAGALAHGMTLTDAELVLILDADFLPEPDFLIETVPRLTSSDVACVQTRWGHLNRDHSALTRGQALGIDVHFAVEQRARAAANWPVAFNGSGGLWRREAIDDAGGWSGDTLTEDLDLSYRAWLRGWKTVYVDRVVCPAEIPETMLAFKAQQRRWARGSTAVARKLLGQIWRSPASFGCKLQATLHLTHYSVHPLILLSSLLALPLGWLAPTGSPLWMVLPVMAMATGGPMRMALAASADEGLPWSRRLRDLGRVMMLGTGLALSNTIAVAKGWFGGPAEFERTAKGGAGSSYRTTADRLGAGELLWAAGCAGGAVWLASRGVIVMVPFLLLYAAGLATVGIATLRETRAARTHRSIATQEA